MSFARSPMSAQLTNRLASSTRKTPGDQLKESVEMTSGTEVTKKNVQDMLMMSAEAFRNSVIEVTVAAGRHSIAA